MRKNKKTIFIISFISLILLIILGSLLINLIGNAIYDGKATTETISLGITIADIENFIVPSSGNVTFTNPTINASIPLISNLTEGWTGNITFNGPCYPATWEEAEPTTSEIRTMIKCFEIIFSNNTQGGNYNLYFNVIDDDLDNINVNDIKLYIYNNSWVELNTFVVNSSSDPKEFYADLTYFSKFIIGEKPKDGILLSSPESSNPNLECSYKWDCTKWNDCLPSEKQKRSCVNIGSCSNSYEIPKIERDCVYIIPETEEALFDVIVSTLPRSEEIFPNTKEVSFQVNLIKFGLLEEITNVKINYEISGEEKRIHEEIENLEIQKEISFIKTIDLPELSPGTYQIYLEIEYDNKTAEAKTSFIVRKEGLFSTLGASKDLFIYLLIFAIILVVGARSHFKLKKPKPSKRKKNE